MKTKNKQHHACPLNIKLESDLSKKKKLAHIKKKGANIYKTLHRSQRFRLILTLEPFKNGIKRII